MGALTGITVLALEQAVAAPFATRQLADLGARVIKVERPLVGDFARGYDETVRGMSSHFVWTNRSKQSITLDLKHERGKDVLTRLIERCDVFVQNLGPGAADRLGCSSEQLQARNPSLIVCNISGYGSNGPLGQQKAYDLLVQCETGAISVTGTPELPSKVGFAVGDIAAGMYAFSGILTALYERERTGKADVLEVSLFDGLSEWMGYPAYYAAYSGQEPARTGVSHATITPYGAYEVKGRARVFIGVQNEREWRRFCEIVLERPELTSDARFATMPLRFEHQRDLDRLIGEAFSELTLEQVEDRLEQAHIAKARLRSAADLWHHPQHRQRGRFVTVDSEVGEIEALLPPIAIRGEPPVMGPIPRLGQDTDAILSEIGFDRQDIRSLKSEGVV